MVARDFNPWGARRLEGGRSSGPPIVAHHQSFSAFPAHQLPSSPGAGYAATSRGRASRQVAARQDRQACVFGIFQK
jgi:hypothetical protein